MSAPRPVEAEYLASAEAALTKAVGSGHGVASFELRLQLLGSEARAQQQSSWSLLHLWQVPSSVHRFTLLWH